MSAGRGSTGNVLAALANFFYSRPGAVTSGAAHKSCNSVCPSLGAVDSADGLDSASLVSV